LVVALGAVGVVSLCAYAAGGTAIAATVAVLAVSNPVGWARGGAASLAILIYAGYVVYRNIKNAREHRAWQEVLTGKGERYHYWKLRKVTATSLPSKEKREAEIKSEIVTTATKKLIELISKNFA
jgi:hypothetical protein